jgi:hypothetical protein
MLSMHEFVSRVGGPFLLPLREKVVGGCRPDEGSHILQLSGTPHPTFAKAKPTLSRKGRGKVFDLSLSPRSSIEFVLLAKIIRFTDNTTHVHIVAQNMTKENSYASSPFSPRHDEA